MHIDFVLPVEHDLMRGFEEWKVWWGCESCGGGVEGVGLGTRPQLLPSRG